MSREIESAKPGETDAFWKAHDRDWRTELWAFRVVWHEQVHDLVARSDGAIAGALRLRIAASLGHVEALYVLPAQRRRGLGRRRRRGRLRRERCQDGTRCGDEDDPYSAPAIADDGTDERTRHMRLREHDEVGALRTPSRRQEEAGNGLSGRLLP